VDPENLTPQAFDEIAARFRLLSDSTRLRLLHALRAGEKSTGELVQIVGTSQPNISKHLSLLRQAGFVSRRQEGTSVYYGITDHSVFELCEVVCGGLEREIQRRRQALGTPVRS